MSSPLEHLDGALAVELAREMLAVRTTNPPGEEAKLAELLLARGERLGLRGELHPVSEGRANVMLRVPGSEGAPRLVYCGHLDTVQIGEEPWRHDPFGAVVADGRLWGRGASDMKGGIAAMLAGMAAVAASGVRLPGELVFVGLVGEEVDCLGAHTFLAEDGMRGAAGLVISEPTGLGVVVAHKGALRVQIVMRGRAAHGALPELGVNAIDHMIELLAALRALDLVRDPHPLLTPPTLSVNRMDGGIRTNIVPDVCRATLDIRTVPGQSPQDLLAEFERLGQAHEAAHPGTHVAFEVIQIVPPVETDAAGPLARATLAAAGQVLGTAPQPRGVPYFSDASVLHPPTGVPTVLFGPGTEEVAHQADEYVDVAALIRAAEVFALLPTLGWLGAPDAEHAGTAS